MALPYAFLFLVLPSLFLPELRCSFPPYPFVPTILPSTLLSHVSFCFFLNPSPRTSFLVSWTLFLCLTDDSSCFRRGFRVKNYENGLVFDLLAQRTFHWYSLAFDLYFYLSKVMIIETGEAVQWFTIPFTLAEDLGLILVPTWRHSRINNFSHQGSDSLV